MLTFIRYCIVETLIKTQFKCITGNKSSKQSAGGDNIRKSFNTAFTNISKFTDKVAKNVKKDLLDINDDAVGELLVIPQLCCGTINHNQLIELNYCNACL